MNVIFHVTTAVGLSVILTDTTRLGNNPTLRSTIPSAVSGFAIGVISHGVLDFIPHCYPVNSKLDVLAGLAMILSVTILAIQSYRIIVAATCLGSVFPDIVDLGPDIVNKYLNLNLTLPYNFFPWHWHEYSGSIYEGDCVVSTLNHCLLMLTLLCIVWARRVDFSRMFLKES